MFEIGNVGISSEPVAYRADPVLTGRGTKPEAADPNALAGTSTGGQSGCTSVIMTATKAFNVWCSTAGISHQIQQLLL